MRSHRSTLFVAMIFSLLVAVPASARNTEVILPARAAAESEMGKAALFGIPFYMKGQKHPKVVKELLEIQTQQSTRGAFRSDDASCNVAFLSAMKVLQRRAQQQGGNAIINVVSTTRNKQTESPTNFRCVAGAFVVHVGLKAQIVTLQE